MAWAICIAGLCRGREAAGGIPRYVILVDGRAFVVGVGYLRYRNGQVVHSQTNSHAIPGKCLGIIVSIEALTVYFHAIDNPIDAVLSNLIGLQSSVPSKDGQE